MSVCVGVYAHTEYITYIIYAWSLIMEEFCVVLSKVFELQLLY